MKTKPNDAKANDILKGKWISMKEAAYTLGISYSSIKRLCEEHDPLARKPYLLSYRPVWGTVLVSRQSVEQHRAATASDPEFWEQRGKRKGDVYRTQTGCNVLPRKGRIQRRTPRSIQCRQAARK
ncbi:MAG TPA: hypothetical protein VGE41_00475 [Verrucomicrobiae bacterium]|jgi:hypothetical protein